RVEMETALGAPYELDRRLGHLDVRTIASMDPERLDKVFRERPALHRFPGNMARRVQAMCAVVVKDYGGDAASVWRGATDGDDLAARISKLPGFGEMKTKILIAVLAKRFGVKPRGWEKHAASWHPGADVEPAETMAQVSDGHR